MERMKEEEISRYELRRLLGIYIDEHEFGDNVRTFMQLFIRYLKMRQIESLLKRASEEIKNMPPNFLTNGLLVRINRAINEDNLKEKLHCMIAFFGVGEGYLCFMLTEICDLKNVGLISEELRNHFANTGTKVPTKEEIAQEFDAEITQQRNANEQRNLQEAQQETTEPHEEAAIL
jgi:hypothetical protein